MSLLSNPMRLVGPGLVAVALLLAIIATATTGWVQYSAGGVSGGIGLFRTCADGGGATTCINTVELRVPSCNSQSDLDSRVRASQAFAVLSILIGAASPAAVLLGFLMAQNTMVGRFASPVAAIAAFLAGGSMLIAFAVHVDTFGRWFGCGQSLCATSCASCSSCGFHYSLGLAVVSWIFFFAGAIMLFLDAKSVHAGGNAAPAIPAASVQR